MKQGEAATATFGLTEAERRYLLGADKGEGLFLARGGRIPLRVVASPAEHELITTAPRELATISADPAGREGGDRRRSARESGTTAANGGGR
jgi:hypothetical protein